MKVFISPHNDDETLFGAFTLLRERPVVVIVYDSYVQTKRGITGCGWAERRAETWNALGELGLDDALHLGMGDDLEYRPDQIRSRLGEVLGGLHRVESAWAPAPEANGHVQHNLVGIACQGLPDLTRYLTYTAAGKSTSDKPVTMGGSRWIAAKLRALACYRSQMSLDPRLGCWPHFLRDQTEYYL